MKFSVQLVSMFLLCFMPDGFQTPLTAPQRSKDKVIELKESQYNSPFLVSETQDKGYIDSTKDMVRSEIKLSKLNPFFKVYRGKVSVDKNNSNATEILSNPTLMEDVEFSSEEKSLLVNLHNQYRSNQTGNIPQFMNMEYMEWDETLAGLAKTWATTVCFGQKQVKEKFVKFTYSRNLYIGPSRHPSRALHTWYMQYKYFDFRAMDCNVPENLTMVTCQHFMTMMWATSNKFGCGRQFCHSFMDKYVISCYYSPAGNIPGKNPFQIGKSCQACRKQESGICWKNLCVTKQLCISHNLTGCRCEQKCDNCGKLDETTCKCICRSGWDGPNCGERCEDSDNRCKLTRKSRCSEPHGDGTVGTEHCRAHCSVCMKADIDDAELCCSGKLCPNGYVLDPIDCSCIVRCPGDLCPFGVALAQSPLEEEKSEVILLATKPSRSHCQRRQLNIPLPLPFLLIFICNALG